MINYENGKKLSALGFLALSGIGFLYLVFALFGVEVIFPYRVLLIGNLAALLAAGGGYGIKWLSDRDQKDFLVGASIALSLLLTIISGVFGVYSSSFIGFIFRVLSAVYFLALAYKTLDSNRMLALALGCAFLYTAFGSSIIFTVIIRWLDMPIIIYSLIHYVACICCHGLCFLAAKQEGNIA